MPSALSYTRLIRAYPLALAALVFNLSRLASYTNAMRRSCPVPEGPPLAGFRNAATFSQASHRLGKQVVELRIGVDVKAYCRRCIKIDKRLGFRP